MKKNTRTVRVGGAEMHTPLVTGPSGPALIAWELEKNLDSVNATEIVLFA